jgi:hypothetical protein
LVAYVASYSFAYSRVIQIHKHWFNESGKTKDLVLYGKGFVVAGAFRHEVT